MFLGLGHLRISPEVCEVKPGFVPTFREVLFLQEEDYISEEYVHVSFPSQMFTSCVKMNLDACT